MFRYAASNDVSSISLTIPLALLAALSAAVAVQSGFLAIRTDASIAAPELVSIVPHSFLYRDATEYFRRGLAVDAPKTRVVISFPLAIMKYQATLGDYNRCVADGVCEAAEGRSRESSEDTPVTGVSYDDAMRYAAWLSKRTGEEWRLPTDLELAYAAADRFPDDALGIDPNEKNPAIRWLADYEREARRAASTDPAPQPKGSFGMSETGLADFGGNIWEWTTTCNKRVDLGRDLVVEEPDAATCGIMIADGKHRAPTSTFVRNPKGGGCSVGSPPDNLGFRLVKRATFAESVGDFARRGVAEIVAPFLNYGNNKGPPDES
ncbi:SUMF1/EgtB/PvdO family nonheme iron enzyme [Rhizobium sp. LjRoot258]|uniref:SUMF1/EgtB/PvdO family nonheme iron enzyme n=1 Tax=Rhizobium sp. LjRoot258 TaxID=3342299 RepID=UPI003ED128B8